jgi:PAS domain S-box-containing protein
MIFIPGYNMNETIHQSDRTLVYRGERQRDRQPVIIKIPRAESPNHWLNISRITHEYAIGKKFNDPGLIKIYELCQTNQGMPALILEEFGGESLATFLVDHPLSCLDFLTLALQLTQSLEPLQKAQIIHQNIHPGNILINPISKIIKLIDFTQASSADRIPAHVNNLRNFPWEWENLPYISPEQTGRMNRGIDYRTDFYSLGVTFYQMLTENLPFQASEPLEWIYCHIAKTPQPLANLRLQNLPIPQSLANIVMKLLAKNAEDRYQSIRGLQADLQTCLDQFIFTGNIENFILGKQDIAEQFQIPQKLYGRAKELATLIKIFQSVNSAGKSGNDAMKKKCSSHPQVVLISGYSGIGKSALVREIHQQIVANRGYFIGGKFDQYQRNIPYSAWLNAMQELICQVLTESEAKVKAWRQKIMHKLGQNAQVMVEVIPELELILGKQPPVKKLGVTESENQFNLLFLELISVFSQNSTLVIFLDDLQWADSASLKLLECLILDIGSATLRDRDSPDGGSRGQASGSAARNRPLVSNTSAENPEAIAPVDPLSVPDSDPDSDSDSDRPSRLLILGAYRDRDLSATEAWQLTLDQIQSNPQPNPQRVTEIKLRPLTINAIDELISDTLQCPPEWTQPLAELLFHKTSGNPFFLKQLLQSLYQQKLLIYNRETRRWQWDIEQIQSVEITENVGELIQKKLANLPPETLNILKLAACLGNRFNLEFLAIVAETSLAIAADQIQPAIQAQLIVPQGSDPSAIASLNPYLNPCLNQGKMTGISLDLDTANSPEAESQIINFPQFVYQFFHDRVQQAVYGLISPAESSKINLKIGQLLLQHTRPDRRYEEIFAIVNHKNLGSSIITDLSQKYELARLNLMAGQKAKLATAYQAAYQYLTMGLKLLTPESWQTHYDLTLVLHIEALQAAYLNMEFAQIEPWAEVILQNAKTTLERVKVYELKIQFYIGSNQIQPAVMNGLIALEELKVNLHNQLGILQELWNIFNDNLFGQSDQSISIIKLPLMTDPHQLAAMRILLNLAAPTAQLNPRLFGLVVLKMVQLSRTYGNSPFAAYGYGIYGAILCRRWQAIALGYELGQLSLNLLDKFEATELKPRVYRTFYGQINLAKCHLKESIIPLRETVQSGLESGDFEYAGYAAVDECLHRFFLGENLLFVWQKARQYLELLAPLNQNLAIAELNLWRQLAFSLSHRECDRQPDQIFPNLEASSPVAVNHANALAKIIVAYLWNQPQSAIETIERYQKNHQDADLLTQIQFKFYSCLLLLMQARTLPKKEQRRLLKIVTKYQGKLKKWALYAPMNFQHKVDLVTAETARLLGDANQAIAAYDRAITGATQQGYIHEAAIANQRAGEFYQERGNQKIAEIYLRDAYDSYLNWGAIAIIEQLETKYPQLFSSSINQAIEQDASMKIDRISHPITPTESPSLDFKTVIKALQALSSEIILENLLDQIMKMLVENAGATTGCLLWELEGTWEIATRAVLNETQTIIGDPSPVETRAIKTYEYVPLSVINYVEKTGEDLILDDATLDERFSRDPYIQTKQPKSMICTSILYQNRLMGLLYLENHLTSSAFSAQNLTILKLLSSQAAICWENAQLYNSIAIREKRLRYQSSTLLKLSQRNRQQNSLEFRKAYAPTQDIFALVNRNFQQKLTSLSQDFTTGKTHSSDRSDDLLLSVKEILEASARTLELERVSVWIYNDQRTQIKCFDLYEQTPNRHTCGMVLSVSDYPTYFRVLSTERIIAAYDAGTDMRTAEFRDQYLIPLGITSMLEAPIRVGGQMVGVLCHEHIGAPRHWVIEEENFAASLADLLALAIERSYRAKAEQERDRFFSLSQDLLCVIDFQGQFTQLNPAWERTLAISSEQMLGKSFLEFVHPEDRPSTQAATKKLVSQQEIITFENRYRCANGSYRWLFWNATPDLERELIYAVVHDITYRVEAEAALKQANEELEIRVEARTAELQEAIASLQDTNQQLQDEIIFRKTTEEALRYSRSRLKDQTQELQNALDQLQRTQIQLVQNEKMASLGQLVAGIAHEINNPVSFIYSNLDPLNHYINDLLHLLNIYRQEYPQSNPIIEEGIAAVELDFLVEDIPKLLESMKSGADRIRKIVLSLRNFSRLDEAAKKRVDLHEGLESTLLILQNQLKDIQLIKNFGELPPVECYSAQINQVFMNILANAIDALQQKYLNSKEKSAQNLSPNLSSDDNFPQISIETEQIHESVRITIADNGLGIPENIQNRIFDPFFTTKPVGSGTGLGLSVSYQIVVETHQGNLFCNSEPGKGTEFVIILPLRLPD